MTRPPWFERWTTRRRLARVGLSLLALAVVWSLAWFAVPPIVRSQLEQVASEKLGRALTVGKVVFNPWTLELTVEDLALAGAGAGAPPQLEIRRIHADAALSSLFHLAPVIDALDIEAPALRLAHLADGRYDLDDIVARIAALPPRPEPARFAVHNIVVHGGSVEFRDLPAAATHRVKDLELGVPFVSSLPAERQIKVEPRLAFTLDGSRFDSAAAATPFSESGAGIATLKLDRFDVTPWLGYLPTRLPVRLQSALLSADLSLAFEQRPRLSLVVRGKVGVDGLKVADAGSLELAEVGSVRVQIAELRPLEAVAKIARIEVDAPHVLAVRDPAGRINLLLAAATPEGDVQPVARVPVPTSAASAASGARRAAAARASSAAGGASAPATAATGRPWTASVDALAIRAGRLDWRDATTAPAAALAVSDFSFDAQAIAWPLDAPVVFKGQGTLGADAAQGRIVLSGAGNAAGATVKVHLEALPLTLARPYLHGVIALPLAAALSGDVSIAWRPGAGEPQLRVDADRVAFTGLTLGDPRTPELAVERVEVIDARLDSVGRTAAIGQLRVQSPRLLVDRGRDGHWNAERWTARAKQGASTLASTASDGGSPWRVVLGDLVVEKGRVGFVDHALLAPATLDVVDLGLAAHGWAFDTVSSVPFRLTARLAVPAGPSGKAVGAGVIGGIDARGELRDIVAGVPSQVRAALLLKDLPLHLLDPYVDTFARIDIQKAQTSFKGDVAWERSAAGASLAVRGDATVDDFRASSPVADGATPRASGGLTLVREGGGGRQLLSWKSLSLRGIDVAVAPTSRTRVSVDETALSDFFARVVLDESGRLNLQDVAQPAAGAASGAASPAAVAVAVSAPAASGSGAVATAAAPAASNASPVAAATGTGPLVRFGPIAVVNGRVAFNDRFVKPNYSANLSELTGRLAAFSSEPAGPGEAPQLAELTLRGRVEGTATLEVDGQVNPIARPLALDIKAKVRDLELPPLSPYAIRYSGYGIDRGKMSVDLAYVVQPDGRLAASNRIILNQLVFGDKVEGSSASLPVKLAVALLADRNGVIDLDLPVSGSINDPQFSLGSVIGKAVTNLIVKAVTAPFALLASAFGGGSSEMQTVEFAPGTATLAPAAREQLDQIAKALVERPALTLTVTGESRLEVEREAWKRERLQQLVRSEKRRLAIAGGAAPSAEVTVAEGEYPALLKEVYRRADIVKPKNLVGVAKDLPPGEMETLLLASIVPTDDAMQQLAVRRAVVVRDYLAAQALPTSRLFLGAPKTTVGDGPWTPRADLKLAMQ